MDSKNKVLQKILCCPACKHKLFFQEDKCVCSSCAAEYPIVNGKYFFREKNISMENSDFLDKFKTIFKKYSAFYNFIVRIVSPVLFQDKFVSKVICSNKIQVEIGCGNTPFDSRLINCDFIDYPNVDVVCDAMSLPFTEGSIDTFINIAVVEHISNPIKFVDELYFSLKPKGDVFTVVPFMQPYHASPHDYQRFTLPGLRTLFSDFIDVQHGVFSGPVSGFLWVFQEFIATILSFGSKRLHSMIFLATMLLTFPVKYLDIIFARYKTAEVLASSFYIWVKKI